MFSLIGKTLRDGVVKYRTVGADIHFAHTAVAALPDGAGHPAFVVHPDLLRLEPFLQQHFYGKGNHYWRPNDDGLHSVDIAKRHVGKPIGHPANLVTVISLAFIQREYQIMFAAPRRHFFFVQHAIAIL